MVPRYVPALFSTEVLIVICIWTGAVPLVGETCSHALPSEVLADSVNDTPGLPLTAYTVWTDGAGPWKRAGILNAVIEFNPSEVELKKSVFCATFIETVTLTGLPVDGVRVMEPVYGP
jgi:hypothetical protein